MSSAVDDRIRVTCSECAAAFRVPATAAGKRGRCPKCQQAFTVPAAEAAATESETDLLGALSEGQATERADSFAASMRDAPPGAGQVVTASTPNVSAKASAAAITAAGGAMGSLLFAFGLCCAGAAVGAGLWYAVAANTGYKIGYIAWAVGGLAGLGMAAGVRKPSVAGGVIAAALSVFAIGAANWFIFTIVIVPNAPFSADIDRQPREALAQFEAMTEVLFGAGEDPLGTAGMSDEEHDAAYREAYATSFDYWCDAPHDEVEAAVDQCREDYLTNQRSVQAGFSHWSMYEPMDLLFIGLALVTAYKVGCSSLRGG